MPQWSNEISRVWTHESSRWKRSSEANLERLSGRPRQTERGRTARQVDMSSIVSVLEQIDSGILERIMFDDRVPTVFDQNQLHIHIYQQQDAKRMQHEVNI